MVVTVCRVSEEFEIPVSLWKSTQKLTRSKCSLYIGWERAYLSE